MNSDHWSEVEKLLNAALEHEPAERMAFLNHSCVDEQLRLEVRSLLEHEKEGDRLLENPPWKQDVRSAIRAGLRRSLSTGTRLGPYEIVSSIGVGGMGEVFRARDTRLDRTVAIKVLHSHLDDDSIRQRFEREARAVSSLNHPNICGLHDIGHQDGIDYLVMEHLQGETLASRLRKGRLPLNETLHCSIEIVSALDHAHRRGVAHRDLKPGNIMLTKAGAKVLDFGLAKIRAVEALGCLTETNTLTEEGVILGTPQYMAPEQVEGKETDSRTDVFAFGCVFYEMLTGKRAFEGNTPSSTVAAVLASEPLAVSVIQGTEQPDLDRIVRMCLAKDPEQRWQSALDLKYELEWIADSGARTAAAVAPPRNPWHERAAWILAATFLGLLLFLATLHWRAGPATDLVRFAIHPPEATIFSGPNNATVSAPQFALSPDGRAIVFVASVVASPSMLWLRPIDEVAARPLGGTENALDPFWSPDSRWIGFFAGGKLKRIRVAGGAERVVAEGFPDSRGGSWGPDGTILFGYGNGSIRRVPSEGGQVTPVTKLDPSRQEGSHRWPQFLPDGRHFLYTVRSSLAEQRGVYVGSLDDNSRKFLVNFDLNALYAPPGYLLFLDGGTLLAQMFDAHRLELSGQPFTLAEPVGRSTFGFGSFSVSRAGILAYAAPIRRLGHLIWSDRAGTQLDSVSPEGDFVDFRLSPDEKRLALSLADPKTGLPDIWLTDLARRSTSRLTFGPSFNAAPLWSPDGTRLVFRTNRKGTTQFYQKSSAGGGKEELVSADVESLNLMPTDWSPDGRHILFSVPTDENLNLWLLSLDGQRKAVRFLSSPSNEMHGNFSPDGHLVAYSSDESGRVEVYVQTFPLSDRRWTISTSGGYEPRWRPDGREMYYLSEDRKLMAVAVGAGPSFDVAKTLFQTRVPMGVNSFRSHYVATRDGQRFLVNTQSADLAPNPITVVLNWTAGLRK